MKYAKIALVGAVAASSALIVAPSAGAGTNLGGAPLPAGLIPLNILNVNDFHGRIDDNLTGAKGKNFACTMITQRQALGSNVLTLGAGDLINASPFTSAVQNDKPTLEFLTAIGLQASATGNHEFDDGFDTLVNEFIPESGFSYVAANVLKKGTTDFALKPYESFDVAGLKVAVIGGVTKDTPNLVSGTGIADLDFVDPVDGVNRVADMLTDGDPANGEADVLIAEYHEGGPYSSTTGTLADQLAIPVFAHLVNDTSPKVAAVLQGHTHQAYVYDVQIPGAAAGSTRPVLQTGLYAANVGKIQLGIDPTTHEMVAYNAANVPVTAFTPTCQADAQWQSAASIVDAAVAYAAPIAQEQIGKVTASITRGFTAGAEDRSRESTLSNLIAQQYLDVVNAPGRMGGAQIGIMNPGGVRADLPYGTDGTVTFAQAAAIMPFGNTIKTVDLTGAQFKQVLEEQWQPVGSSRPYLQLGLSDNVTYTFDPTLAQGSRITAVTVNGRPIDPAGVYTVASNSFLVTQVGAPPDGFATMQRGTNYRDSGLVDQNAFMDWIKANSPVAPSYKKHAIAIIGAPTRLVVGQPATFLVEGPDLASLGVPSNLSVQPFLLNKRTGTVTSVPVNDILVTTPIPTREGQATVTFTPNSVHLKDAIGANGDLGGRSANTVLKLVFKDTGTVAYYPIVIARK